MDTRLHPVSRQAKIIYHDLVDLSHSHRLDGAYENSRALDKLADYLYQILRIIKPSWASE